MPLFNLSALTRHTAYSAAFLLYVAIRKKITRLLRIQSSLLIGKHFPYFAGHPSSAAKSTAPPWQTRLRYSRQVTSASPAGYTHRAPTHSLTRAGKLLFRSLEQVEGLWKDRALGLFLPNFTRLMRPAEESLLETGQHEPCRASHLESRGACLPHLHLLPTPSYGAGSVILSPSQRARTRTERNCGWNEEE